MEMGQLHRAAAGPRCCCTKQPNSPTPQPLPGRLPRRGWTLEYVPIDLDVLLLVRRHILFRENRRDRAFRLTGPTVDALVGMDVKHLLAFVYAIDWADVHAGPVLNVDTRFSDDVRHGDRVGDQQREGGRPNLIRDADSG